MQDLNVDSDDPDQVLENFIDIMNFALDRYCPMVTKTKNRLKKADKPWCTHELKILIKEKNKVHSKFLRYPITYGDAYRRLRNQVNNSIRSHKKLYYQSKLNLYRNDSKKKWSVINELLGRKQGSEGLDEIVVDGLSINDKQKITDEFNSYFHSVPHIVRSHLPPPTTNFYDYLTGTYSSSFYLRPMTPHDLITIVNSLNDSGGGFLNIPTKVIKCHMDILIQPLCTIYNMCIRKGYFPKLFKIAQITPVYKSGPKSDVANYRPISVLSPFSKIFEKYIYKQLIGYFESNHILIKEQSGFRSNFTTDISTGKLLDLIVKDINKQHYDISLFIDFLNAFDLVNHNILLRKLYFYGIRGIPYNLLASFLTDRYQYVFSNGFSSKKEKVDIGVVQGSILGPLLFIIFVNDIGNSSPVLKFNLFADDTSIYYGSPNLHESYQVFNNELEKVSNWILANGLSLNSNKTYYMLFCGNKKVHNTYPIKMFGRDITRKRELRFLGLILDDKLSWKSHIHTVTNKVSRMVGIFF